MKGPRHIEALFAAPLFAATLLLLSTPASAEPSDVVDGRLVLSASYGFDATFFQDERASNVNPHWGHGVFLRLGGERCGRLCVGLSVLGAVGVEPGSTGAVGVGPHIGYRWGGPDWAGAYNARIGAAYYYLWSPEPNVNEDGELELAADVRGNNGVGVWLSIGLELLRRPGLFTPIIGIKARYAAAIPSADGDAENWADTVEHHLSAQVFFAVAIGRRLVFGEGAELDLDDEDDDDGDDDHPMELDDEEERILRQTEDELRR